jgi:hypothetical protein
MEFGIMLDAMILLANSCWVELEMGHFTSCWVEKRTSAKVCQSRRCVQ